MGTWALPVFVADGALSQGNVRIAPFAVNGTFVQGNVKLPTYLLGATYLAWVPTGGMVMGGAADVFGDPFIPSGGMKMGGAAVVAVNPAPTGGMKMGGAAVISAVLVNVYDITVLDAEPQGGMLMGGAAVIGENITWVPVGGMLMGGGAIIQESIRYPVSGGMLMGGTAPLVDSFVVLPTGGMLMSGTSPVVAKYAELPSGGMVMGGTSPFTFRESIYIPSGGMAMGGTSLAYMVPSHIVTTTENPYGDVFPGWAVNFETNAASRYLGLPANGITQFGGKTYVSNNGGIYEIGADDDAGQPIHASVQWATTDFQDSHDKRMEVAYIGVKTTGKMKLRIHVNDNEPQYYLLIPKGDNPKGTRVPIGKGLVGRYWNKRLDNVNGADFAIESAEFEPIAGQRHGA
jgi:hypothetical protein